MAKFTDKELMELGKEMNESRAKILHKWGFSDEEIQAVLGIPDFEIKRILSDGVNGSAEITEKQV